VTMSCEIYIDDNAQEYDITVSGDSTCDKIDLTIEVGGEELPIETDPVFMSHPVYAVASGDITHWNAGYAFTTSHLSAYDHTDIHEAHSDDETASTIGTLLSSAASGTPADTDLFIFVQLPGNTLKKITYAALKTLITTPSGGVSVDYSGIIASLNLLTDTSDSAYDGTDPTLAGMETQLDTINGEVI